MAPPEYKNGVIRDFLPEDAHGVFTLMRALAQVRWAAVNGVTRIFTGNDETNAPMRAVNRRLGYRPIGVLTNFSREEGMASGPAPEAPGP